ncbi:MAG TPA: hypothetical protein VK364_11900, partial [Hymenobacter sp.]|nr:hypothetical protein [Hymenobacter sp.]
GRSKAAALLSARAVRVGPGPGRSAETGTGVVSSTGCCRLQANSHALLSASTIVENKGRRSVKAEDTEGIIRREPLAYAEKEGSGPVPGGPDRRPKVAAAAKRAEICL